MSRFPGTPRIDRSLLGLLLLLAEREGDRGRPIDPTLCAPYEVPSINAGLAELARQGMVTTRPDPHHAVHRAVLTVEGRAWLDDNRDDLALDLWEGG